MLLTPTALDGLFGVLIMLKIQNILNTEFKSKWRDIGGI